MFNQSVGSLSMGMSQQRSSITNPGFAELQVNAVSDPVLGLSKRAGTRYQGTATIYSPADAYFHWYERGDERYVIVYDGRALLAYDSLGRAYTISVAAGVLDYLAHSSLKPREYLRSLTINDTTLLLNTTKPVQMDAATTPAASTHGTVWIRSATYNQSFGVELNGTRRSVKNDGNNGLSVQTQAAASALAAHLSSGTVNTPFQADVGSAGSATVSAPAGESVFTVAGPTTLSGFDSRGNSSVSAFVNEVDSFDDLPSRAKHGTTVRVTGLAEEDADDYWVRFEGDLEGSDIESGLWVECAEPGSAYKLDQATMPIQIVRTITEGVVSFEANFVTWGERAAGSAETNKNPSFVGHPIDTMFLAQNRLGFTSRDKVILSRADDLFQFFRTTVTSLPDDERIDVTVNNARGSTFFASAGMSDEVVLLGNSYQAAIYVGDPITPATFQINDASTLQLEDRVQPVKAGRVLYLAERSGPEYTGIREYFSQSDRLKDSTRATELVPQLIAGKAVRLDASTPQSTLLVLAEGTPHLLYQYRWADSGSERIQAAWSYHDFGEAEVVSFRLYDDYATIVTSRRGRTHFETLPLDHTSPVLSSGAQVHLDRMIETIVAVPEPVVGDLSLLRVDVEPDAPIPQGARVSLGTTTQGDSAPSAVFRIRNDGEDSLSVNSIQLIGSGFTLTPPSLPAAVAVDGTVEFTVALDSTANVGVFSADVVVLSNDPDASEYVFSITALVAGSSGGGGGANDDAWQDVGDSPLGGGGDGPSIGVSAPTVQVDQDTVDVTLPYRAIPGVTTVVDPATGLTYAWSNPPGDTATVRVVGAPPGATLIIGDLFDMEYRLAELKMLRSGPSGGPAPLVDGWLNVLRFVVRGTGDFSIVALRGGQHFAFRRSTRYRVGDRLGDALPRQEVSLGVYQRAHEVRVGILSRSPFPASIESAEWEGEWFGRSRPL